jgi:YesN/AraC family two-component response regulator
MQDIFKYIKKITVLYVEDDDATREEVSYFLESKVSKLYVAKNGEEGLAQYKEMAPDLVITDINMPKLSGIQMSSLIKELDPEARIIIITAFNHTDHLFDAIKLNVNDYITKPLDIKQLIKIMAKIARNTYLEKENKEINNTLQQYKDVIDERSIISKTDKYNTPRKADNNFLILIPINDKI